MYIRRRLRVEKRFALWIRGLGGLFSQAPSAFLFDFSSLSLIDNRAAFHFVSLCVSEPTSRRRSVALRIFEGLSFLVSEPTYVYEVSHCVKGAKLPELRIVDKQDRRVSGILRFRTVELRLIV